MTGWTTGRPGAGGTGGTGGEGGPARGQDAGATRRARTRHALVVALSFTVLCAVVPRATLAVPISVTYIDGPEEGFNDPALGSVRRAAFEFAARMWADTLAGTVPVVVEAAMDPLGGNAANAVLGSTAATTLHRNFPGAPLPDTWYGAALANQLSATDLNGPETSEIQTTFNSDVDEPHILGAVSWSYGLAGQPGTDIDFVTVALHELTHGFNFFALVDPATGGWPDDTPGVYGTFLVRARVGRFTNLVNAQRLAAVTSNAVFWDGASVRAASGDDARIFAPTPYQPGSSLSHWDISLSAQLLAPFYTTANHDPGLALPALRDMGWELTAAAQTPRPTPTPQATPTPSRTRRPTRTATPTPLQPVHTRRLAYVTNFDANTVSVIDTGSNAVATTIPVGDGPIGVAISPDGTAAYVANFRASTVSVITTRTGTVTAVVPVPGAPNDLAVTPDGALVYVTNTSPGTVSVIDTDAKAVVATIPVGPRPSGIALTPNGFFALVTNFGANTVSVIDTGAQTVVATIVVDQFLGQGPLGIAIAPNGRVGYVTGFFSHAIFTLNTVAFQSTGFFFPPLPSGTPEGLAITPDGRVAYVTNSSAGRVSVIETATNEGLRSVTVGGSPEALAITPDGAFVYVANAGTDTVSVIRTDRNSVVTTIPAGETPMGVAIGRVRQQPCAGDCDDDGRVTVSELLEGFRIALGSATVMACPNLDTNASADVTVDELVAATTNALGGCPQ